MQAAARKLLSVDEYIALEEETGQRHEYYQGEVFAMAGASLAHGTLQFNVIRLLGNQLLDRPCQGFPSDNRVFVEAHDLYAYPDLSIVCGEVQRQDTRALLNPTLLVEILSPSTEAYDRGEKFAMYRSLESLQQYVLIAQDRQSVEVFTRQADGRWIFQAFSDPEVVVPLESIGCELSLAQLYHKVEFPPRPLHRVPDNDRLDPTTLQ